jgi:vacuolar-type H+-ATPase subunit F/Vma7
MRSESARVYGMPNLRLTPLNSSVTGLLLAGVGHVTDPPDSQKNFLVCDAKTEKSQIEQTFARFTKERKDIGIVLINQHVCRDDHLLRRGPQNRREGLPVD